MPKRIQRKRTKGWRMPEGAVYVGRPTRFGNSVLVDDWPDKVLWEPYHRRHRAAEWATQWYRHILASDHFLRGDAIARLRGKDLVCWCPLDQPCHADVLLDVVNP